MSKKLKFGLNAGAITGHPPKWIYNTVAALTLLATLKHQFIDGLPVGSDAWKELAGGWFDYLVALATNILALLTIIAGYAENDKPDTDNTSPSSYIKVIILMLGLSLLLTSCNKKTMDTLHTIENTDSSWLSKQKIKVPVPGGATRAVNMDSLRMLLEQYRQQQAAAPQVNLTMPEQNMDALINKINSIADPTGRYELQYWMTATGELMARCSAKDTTIEALVEAQNRLQRIVDKKETVKVIYKTPPWFRWIIGIVIVAVVIIIVLVVFKLIRGKK